MSHPARGPVLFGDRRQDECCQAPTDHCSHSQSGTEAPLVSYLARGPGSPGIDSKASAAGRRHCADSTSDVRKEAARVSGSATDQLTSAKGLPGERPKALAPPMPPSWLTILTLAALLSGCPAVTEQNARSERWYDTVVEPLQSDTERALRFYDRIIRLKGPELAQELATAKLEFEKEKSGLNRMQFAMLLSVPGAAFRDDHAAANLLQHFLKDKNAEDSPLRPLAVLLNSQLSDSHKLEEALQQQTAKTKEEQRKSDALQQKLEALLEMEMKMLEREQTIPTKKK